MSENILDLESIKVCLDVQPEDSRGAVISSTKWKPGQTLRVRFLDGDPIVQQKIEAVAHQWSQYTNIKFEFGNDPNAEIRISCQPGGSWSYIGTDALAIAQNQPTMNYGWLQADTPDEEYSRVVLHEFGHALGCIHEHQHPEAGIPWNRDAVYRYYMGPPNNWTKEGVDNNLFAQYSKDVTQFSHFDTQSIMLYPIPKELTTNGFEVGWNTHLSETDKAFMGQIYPLPTGGWTEIGGLLKQISVGSATQIWGVTNNDEIFQYLGNSNWQKIDGSLNNVSVAADGTVYGVNASGNIFHYLGNNSWQGIGGLLKQISVGSATQIWGVTNNDEIFQYLGNSNWQRIDGSLNNVSVAADGTVYGVNASGNIFQRG